MPTRPYLEDFTPFSRISGSGLAAADSSRRVVKCRDDVFINLTRSTAGTRRRGWPTVSGRVREYTPSLSVEHIATPPRHSPSKDRLLIANTLKTLRSEEHTSELQSLA